MRLLRHAAASGNSFDLVRYWYTNGRPSRVEVASAALDLSSVSSYTPYYIQYNWHGDAVAFAPLTGGYAGTYDPHGIYDPWGNPSLWPPNSLSTWNYYRWAGAWGYMKFDDLGLYYIHGRWYNPETGLWLSPNAKGEYRYEPMQDGVNGGWVNSDTDVFLPPTLAPILHADTLPKRSSVDTGDLKGYSLLLVCGKSTDCVHSDFNPDYGLRPLQALKDSFEAYGGAVDYLPGRFDGDPQSISRGGNEIANTLTFQRMTRIKGVFLAGHSLGGNYVIDGLAKFGRATNYANVVKGVVLIEPDLATLNWSDLLPWNWPNLFSYPSRLDRKDVATELSYKYPMLLVQTHDWDDQHGAYSVPSLGSPRLEKQYLTRQNVPLPQQHLLNANHPDMVKYAIDFFLRHKY